MEIDFEGQLTREELFRAVALANQPSRHRATARFGLAVLAAGVYLALLISAAGGGFSSEERTRGIRLLITLLLVELLLFQPFYMPYFTARKLWSNALMRTPDKGSITDHGVVYQMGDAVGEYPWESYAKLRKSDKVAALITADRILCPFPRSYFHSAEDWDRFIKIADFHVKEAK